MQGYCLSLFFTVSILYFCAVCGDLRSEIDVQLRKGNSTSLLRKKRYLVFPEGSSFQVVYDLAYPSVDGIGFFVYGNTAALAWELPSTPVFLEKKFQKHEEPEPTTTMLPHLEHHDDYEQDWQPPESWEDNHKSDFGWQSKVGSAPNFPIRHNARLGHAGGRPVSSYANPFHSYANADFNSAYPSNNYPTYYPDPTVKNRYPNKSNPKNLWSRRNFQNRRNKPTEHQSYEHSMEYLDRQIHSNIHRRTRRELYGKLEELFSTLVNDGKSCVLKVICQVHQTPKGKGTFFEELLKTIFKVKPDEEINEDHYDQAANLDHNCDNMYPKCKGNPLDQLMSSVLNNKMSHNH